MPIVLLLALVLAAAPSLNAQETGEKPAPGTSVLDGVFTAEQAERGEAVFANRCTGCHAPGYFQAPIFIETWAGRPVRSLYRRMSTTMPEDNPGGLQPSEYAAVLAYILELNGYPAGETELPSDTEALRAIMMVAKGKGG